MSVCLSVNTITPEQLETLSRNFQGISSAALKMRTGKYGTGNLLPFFYINFNPVVERANKFENGYYNGARVVV